MNRKLFDKTLDFEINLIGYKNKGESIVFFLKAEAGDVEDRTIKIIPDFNIDVKDKMDYLKIPHHSSGSSSYLIDRFRNCDIESPTVATTTVYRRYSLPDKKVLKMYFAWGKESVIYATGDIENVENDCEKNGVIKTVFDITERKNVPIETALFGNAVCIGRDI